MNPLKCGSWLACEDGGTGNIFIDHAAAFVASLKLDNSHIFTYEPAQMWELACLRRRRHGQHLYRPCRRFRRLAKALQERDPFKFSLQLSSAKTRKRQCEKRPAAALDGFQRGVKGRVEHRFVAVNL